MGTYTVEYARLTGLNPTANAVAASDTFANDGNTTIRVANGSGSSITVAVVSTATLGGLAVADVSVSVANGATRVIGPFNPEVFSRTCTVTYTGTTSVTAECVSNNKPF